MEREKSVRKQKSKKKNISGDIYEKKIKNRQTNTISFIFVGLFLLLAGYLIYFNLLVGPQVINNPYNKRIDNLNNRVARGEILSKDGEVLASTVTDKSGQERREYPYGSVFSHVVGLSTHGKTGIEGLTNFYLLSTNGNIIEQMANDISGKKSPGDNIITTLDVGLQKAADKALGNNKGAVVAMEPSTGRILAMVSKPDFDPNEAVNKWDEWINYESSDSVLLNRATQGLYPPGSTFKILTALEYMRENPASYQDFQYQCKGSTTTGKTTIHCFDNTVHGSEDLNKAFANSCNSAFATIGQTLQLDRFHTTAEEMLFNSELPIGIEYNKSSFVLNLGGDTNEVMQTSIGQGRTQITPFHNLLIASAVANKGVLMQPYLVDKIETSDNRTVKQYQPIPYQTLMTEEEASTLTDYMRSVVTMGTGSSFRKASYNAAGKTGSAQYDDSENYHSLFVGFAPEDNPQIAISVILEGGYKGNTSAQAVAKKVLDEYFQE